MKHSIEISVSEGGGHKNTVLKSRKISLPKKLWRLFFGLERKAIILVPGDSVESVSIKEVESNAGS
ncbi:MAG: hypothetical protein WCQ41_06280 [Bacillota bacterium]